MSKMKIELDGNLFKPKERYIWIYALDNHCVGVSARFITSWKKSLFTARIPYKKIGNKIVFQLPESLHDFYCLVQHNTKIIDSYSQNADIVLLTIMRKQ